MNKIILKDNTEIQVPELAGIYSITTTVENIEGVQSLKDKLTPDNISEIKVQNDAGLTTGEYSNLVLNPNWTIAWTDDGIKTTFTLREKTEIELLREEIAAKNTITDGAIADLAQGISDIAGMEAK